MRTSLRLITLFLFFAVSRGTFFAQQPEQPSPTSSSTFLLISSAFSPGAAIPRRHSCEGENISPPLAWKGAPAGTVTLALIVEDPDAPAGTYTHWVIWNLPATVHELPAGVPRAERLKDGAQQGENSDGKSGYDGPCPPAGRAHRYFFRLSALDRKLYLAPGAGRVSLLESMKGHVLGQAEYMGRYSTQSNH